MPQPLSFDATPTKTLDAIYQNLNEMIGEENFLHRVERDFGTYDKRDVFAQTDNFNVFLYLDGGTFHGLEAELSEEDEVLNYIERTYDIDLEDL